MKKILMLLVVLGLLLPIALADQTLDLKIDSRDLPYTHTFEIPTVGLDEAEEVNIETSSSWLIPKKTLYIADQNGSAIVMTDLTVPVGTMQGNYTEKIYIWTLETRSEITVKMEVKRTIKQAELTIQLVDIFTDYIIENGSIELYTNPMYNKTTDKNGLVAFKSVDEGCWDLFIMKKGYEKRTTYVCANGYAQRYNYYLVGLNRSNMTKDDEIRAYRNALDENADKIRAMQEFTAGFVPRQDLNITCPNQEEFSDINKSLILCQTDRDTWRAVSNITALSYSSLEDDDESSTRKMYWAIGIASTIAIIVAGYLVLKKLGLLGGGMIQ